MKLYSLLIFAICFNLLNGVCPCQFKNQQSTILSKQQEFYKVFLKRDATKIRSLLNQEIIFDTEGNPVSLFGSTNIFNLLNKNNNSTLKESINWYINKINTETLNPEQWYNIFVSILTQSERKSLNQILYLKLNDEKNYKEKEIKNRLTQSTPDVRSAYEKALRFSLNYKKMAALQSFNHQSPNYRIWLNNYYFRAIK